MVAVVMWLERRVQAGLAATVQRKAEAARITPALQPSRGRITHVYHDRLGGFDIAALSENVKNRALEGIKKNKKKTKKNKGRMMRLPASSRDRHSTRTDR